MGLNVCGVDMLRSNHGPVVMEVNSSPGLEGVEKATGIDVAGEIVAFIEKNARTGNTRTKGRG
jgi:ribosomal protein S6--L-glutamate ligase